MHITGKLYIITIFLSLLHLIIIQLNLPQNIYEYIVLIEIWLICALLFFEQYMIYNALILRHIGLFVLISFYCVYLYNSIHKYKSVLNMSICYLIIILFGWIINIMEKMYCYLNKLNVIQQSLVNQNNQNNQNDLTNIEIQKRIEVLETVIIHLHKKCHVNNKQLIDRLDEMDTKINILTDYCADNGTILISI